jgi:DNA-binding LacI/PurR family transcriptional regulator
MATRVTIETVARRSNVSRQTVSNVLNTPDLVRPETRARVMAAIEELGYRTHLAARQMRTGRSYLVAVRIDPVRNGIEGAVLDRFLHGLTEAAAPAGYRVVLYTAADDAGEIATFDELLSSYALDGFILTHTHHGDARTSWLRRRAVPFVTFGRPWEQACAHSWVDVDGAAGTARATRHLIDVGHRRIAFVGWPEGSGVGDDRREGWARTMAEAGLSVRGLERHSVDGFVEGTRAARGLTRLRQPPTGYVCASDPLAMGVLRAAPDAAVVGFDDTPMAAATGLSSVRQPLSRAAAECVRLLVGRLDPASAAIAENVLLEPELIVRDGG